MKKILFALLCMLNIGFVHAATEMTDVYLLAQTKNAKELQNIKDIDIVNKNGDTALCSAIKDGNVDAYNLLKKAGANIEHKCIKKIPAQQYEQFITKVVSANNSWSFLGLGKWAWTAIGVGAAGVAAGAAVSGGGSGAGSSVDTDSSNTNNNPNDNTENNYSPVNNDNQQNQSCESQGYTYENSDICPDGWQLGSSCTNEATTKYKCNQPAYCSSNYKISCPSGYVETENTCKSGDITYHECEPVQLNCVNGVQNGIQCTCVAGWSGTLCDTPVVCPYETTSCTGMYQETGETCLSGDTLYKECETVQCGAHTHLVGTQCVCNDGYENWQPQIGCSVISLNCGEHAYQVGTQCQCSYGYTNWVEGQGCYLMQNCGEHAYQVGTNCVCEPGYENWVHGTGCSIVGKNNTTNISNVYINDSGWGDVYGREHGTTNYSGSGGLLYLQGDGRNRYITKNYPGNTYGVFVDVDTFLSKPASVSNFDLLKLDSNLFVSIEKNYDIGNGSIVAGIYASLKNHNLSGQSFEFYNTTAAKNNDAYAKPGTIIINNYGNASVYGVHANNVDGKVINSYVNNEGKLFTGTININSVNNNEFVYGIYANTVINLSTSLYSNSPFSSYGYIYINNSGNSRIYGIYGVHNATNVLSYLSFGKGKNPQGLININNTGNGDVYGVYSTNESFNSKHKSSMGNNYYYDQESISEANININNTGNGDVYGIYGRNASYNFCYNSNTYEYDDVHQDMSYAKINIINDGTGNTYGLYSNETYDTPRYAINADGGIGIISITNKGVGNAYGIYGDYVYNAGHPDYFSDNPYGYYKHAGPGTGFVNLTNKSSGNIFGMYGTNVSNENSDTDYGSLVSIISLQNLSSGNATGIYTANGTVNNSGEININNVGTGTVFGIFGDNNSTIDNSGVINITRESYVDESNVLHTPSGTAGDIFGIYAKSGSSVNNSGNITINTNGNAYGIYVESDSTVINTGTISLNGVGCSGSDCNTGNYIVLNGSTLYNSGAIKAATLQLNSMKGKVIANADSSFIVDNKLSGDLYMSNDIIMDSNQTTYVAKNMIDAGDTSELNLVSDSVMFDAYLSGRDVVMQIKDFDSLTDNKSLATFLKHNYNAGNGRELFAALKSMDNMSAFNGALSGFTGLNTFTQFAHEDLSAMREISFSMNNKLFENSGRDSFDISDSMGYFSFSDGHNGGSGQYGISSSKMSDNWKLGYGMAMANINTNDGAGMYRQNKMWLFYMPATYTNDDIELVIAPKAGFAHTEYNRRGYNNMNYDGYIEKHIVGLMNDLRYPLNLGNWTFAPDLAFNTIVYTQYGEENEQEFSLIVPHDNTVSVETGLGLYGKYEKETVDGSRFKFTTGIMGYREFGNTYNIKLGMRGMDGTFDLYNNDYKYRGALNIGIDYSTGLLRIFGNTQYFMDNANYMNFKGGISYKF